MQDDSSPVSSDEYVLRRIPKTPNWYDPSDPGVIESEAFRPNDKDVDGISVFREKFTTPHKVAAAGLSPKGYYIARLKVADIEGLGLSVKPVPMGGQPRGHSVIPELCPGVVGEEKKQRKEMQASLAELASIVDMDNPH